MQNHSLSETLWTMAGIVIFIGLLVAAMTVALINQGGAVIEPLSAYTNFILNLVL